MSDDGAQDGRGKGPRGGAEGDLSGRLERLDARLQEKRPVAANSDTAAGSASPEPSAMGRAFRMSAEFVAGVVAGGGLGYLLDRVAGTSPWGLIVLLLLGFGAGVWNVMRASGFLEAPGSRRPPG
jgi:ATP synthase protein I